LNTPHKTPDLSGNAHLPLLSLTMPVAMGYIPLGIVFGFLFVQAGGTWWLATASSVLVYAGAAQYMMIPMLAAGLPVGSIALATLVINLRHVFYGLSLLERYPARGPLRWYMVFALTDETYSVLTTLPPNTPVRTLGALAALNQGWWVLGTTVGALVGSQAQVPLQGLDFVLVSLFAVLVTEQWRKRSTALPVWAALVGYALAYWAVPQHALVASIGLCVGVALLWRPSGTREMR
jgi:4-azaleucine resistance transporter AzlC